MTLLYNMYKPIIIHSGLFSELGYMSNGLTFEMLNGISQNCSNANAIPMNGNRLAVVGLV